MSRRKSLNRRLSRYSKNSTGSAFLDPDTENLGDEQPHWWKNLENNTVMQPSMSYNTPNQTSPILDPNSRVDSSQLQDGWWKVLETTDIADNLKLTMPTRKPDADNNTVTTLESDEEPRIIKKKVTLRSRKSRGNPFVNISESETSDKKSTEESPMNKSESIDKATTSSKHANKLPESSSGLSHSTDVVLKLKPTLFKRKHKDRQRNVFDDVLKENEVLTPEKRKSLKLSSHSKPGLLMENKILATTDSPIVKQGGTRKLVLSFENDHDLARLPNPEAQSTLLESSSSTHSSNKDNSEMEARVLKPKSTFLKRRKRGANKNVFADIFAEEETRNDVEISKWKEKGIDANAEASQTCSVRQASGSIRGSQCTPSNVVNEIRAGDAKATKGSRSTEAITPSVQDPRGPVKPNASAQTSIASSDTSDKSQDPNIFLKPRSTFLKRSCKRSETNIFQEILEEDGNVDALRRSRSHTGIDLTKKDLMMKDQATVARETSRRGTIDQESNTDLEELHLELAGSSEENGNNAEETSALYRNTESDIEISELGSEPKEKRQRHSALHVSTEIPEISNRRTASLPRIINEVSKSRGGPTWSVRHRESGSDVDVSVTSKHEEGNHIKSHSRNQHERDVLEENKGSARKLYTQFSIVTSDDSDQESKIIERTRRKGTSKLGKPSFRSTVDDSEPEDLQSTPSRLSKKLRTLIRQSTVVTHRDTDLEPALSTSKRQSKNLSKSQKLLSSCVISEAEVDDVQVTPKRQSRNSSVSQKLLSSCVMSEDEAEEVPATSKRQSRSLSKSQKLLCSRVLSDAETEEVQATSKRQSKNLSLLQKSSSSHVISEDEAEEVPATSKRQSKSLNKSQKLLSSRIMSEDEAEEIQSTRKTRESKSVGKAQKRSTSNAIKEFEAENPNTPVRRSKVLSKLPNNISSAVNQIEPCEIDGGAKSQSKSISRLERQSTVGIVNVSVTKDVEISRKKHSRNFMSRESVSPARGDSQLTVPITDKSTMHRVQEEEEVVEEEEEEVVVEEEEEEVVVVEEEEVVVVVVEEEEEEEAVEEEQEVEEEEEGGIDAGSKICATRRSEPRIEFNPNVTKDREDEDLFNASSKNAKEAKEVSRNDTGRNVGKNRSVALDKAKGSMGPTKTSTNRGKDSSRSQRNIEDFLFPRETVPAAEVFADKEKAEKFKRELEKIKKQAMDNMKLSGNSHKSKLPLQQKKPSNLMKTAKATQKQRPAKPIHKAFLVNGQVYKVPRLPRPKYWVTDRLYKYLWKQLEPKYTLQTRVISEKFVQQMSNVTSFIVKQKSYASYKAELYALMKEMARLGIIRTRYEFYTFCQEFFPYELRIKMVPMLLPGNKRNIPYEKDKLNKPLLRS